MKKYQIVSFATIFLAIGVIVGGYLFSRSIPRSFISVHRCEGKCFNQNELVGLLASVGIQKIGSNLPKVIFETDKTLVFDIYPYPPEKIHYVVVPKKDIKDESHLTDEDKEYLVDAYAVIGRMVRDNNYRKYKIITNGPGYQKATYLHFHLVVDRNEK